MVSLLAVCGVDVDQEFIPHHLPFYAERGVESFHYILHSENPDALTGPASEQFIELAKKMGVSLSLYHWLGRFNSNVKIRRMGRIVCQLGQEGLPLVIADMDEYHDIADYAQLRQRFPTGPCVYGQFVDVFAGTPLPNVAEVLPDVPILEQFPVRRRSFAKRADICGCTTKPIVLFTPRYTRCHGMAGYTVDQFRRRNAVVRIFHVRWTTSRRDKSLERAESFRAQGLVHWTASRNSAEYLESCPVYER